MTGPHDRPLDDGLSGGPASDPGPGPVPQPGAPAGFPTPPGAVSGAGYGAPTAFGAPAGYAPPAPYGAPPALGTGGLPALASWGSRVGAALLDALLGLAILAVAVVLGIALGSVSEALGAVVLAVGYFGALGFYVWQLVVQGRTGQTIGKKRVGIRLLKEQDGQPVGAGLSVARAFLHVVDQIPCYVGYLWPLWDAKRQTFADKILSTVVVRA